MNEEGPDCTLNWCPRFKKQNL